MDYSLSSRDIHKLFEGQCNIVLYSDLPNYPTLDDLFNGHKLVFLLYQTKPNYGHWVVLCKHKRHVYFFDPYGMFPDDELDYTYKKFPPWLSGLLIDSPYSISYNKHKLQDITDPDIATCGRWCCLYAYAHDDTSFDEFADIFRGMDPDEAITLATSFI